MKTQNLIERLLIILVFCGAFSSCKRKPADESIVRSSKYKKSLIEAYQKVGVFSTINYIPGLTVAVSIDKQLVWADGFGYSSQELKAKASPSHKFRIGQVTELITSLTAAKLYEEGKLKIDQPVSEIIPGLSKQPANYTIYQLGVHSAGLRPENVQAGKGEAKTIDAIIPSFIDDDLLYEPGTSVGHTELGFDLLGYIIQKTNNRPFNKLVQEILIDKLKLANTTPDNLYSIIANKSNTYDYDYLSQPGGSQPIDLRGKEASAGYLSSVIDLVEMGNALLYPGFLKQETIDLITKPFTTQSGQTAPFGFGLIVNKDNEGRRFYGQRGAVNGGSCILLIYPEDKLVIAMASNVGNCTWELPAFEVASVFQNQLHPEKAKAQEEKQKQEEAPQSQKTK